MFKPLVFEVRFYGFRYLVQYPSLILAPFPVTGCSRSPDCIFFKSLYNLFHHCIIFVYFHPFRCCRRCWLRCRLCRVLAWVSAIFADGLSYSDAAITYGSPPSIRDTNTNAPALGVSTTPLCPSVIGCRRTP